MFVYAGRDERMRELQQNRAPPPEDGNTLTVHRQGGQERALAPPAVGLIGHRPCVPPSSIVPVGLKCARDHPKERIECVSPWAVSGVWCLSIAPALAQDFYLKDGDRVVFYGDSITEQREYTARVEEFVLSRFPAWNVSFVHAGVGGDTVRGGWAGEIDERLSRDVIPFKPTVVTIMLGMNDGGYKAVRPADVRRRTAPATGTFSTD